MRVPGWLSALLLAVTAVPLGLAILQKDPLPQQQEQQPRPQARQQPGPRQEARQQPGVQPPPQVPQQPSLSQQPQEQRQAHRQPVTQPQPPAPAADGKAPADAAAVLASRPLVVPVAGVRPDQLVDTYTQPRGGRLHEAIDILAPKGTPVVAVDDGVVAKLFTSKPGGLTVYHFDPSGRIAYYYAHLDRYAPGLQQGQALRRGDLVGYVGVTGNADPGTPHLHFAIFALGPGRQWWKGTPLNPHPALRQGTAAPLPASVAAR